MSPHTPPTAPGRRTSIPGNLLRGGLIGLAETVPGVSGGTVALVVGIYDELIGSASHLVSAIKALVTGPDRLASARAHLRATRWRLLIPVAVGMATVVLAVAGPMADAVEHYPVQMRGLFFGMVLASISVPVRMVRDSLNSRPLGSGARPRWLAARLLGIGATAAVITWLLVSRQPSHIEPHPLVIVPAAAVAVAALVLPGLSGSFLLLTFGLYEPTLRAVDERDLGYLGLFILGAMLGLALVVKSLQWLLAHHQVMTLCALIGLMVGGLRALWPWQDEMNRALAPGHSLGAVLALGLLGFALVTTMIVVDLAIARRSARERLPDTGS
ncbi:DUF368 domain-containing protein [Actinomyces capricornis]|uniref:DUF368 domain-containing protein n=1 Tax=Actinomyces capricornis TaxID=2755559 RepID=A0ABM7U8F3_9ACTO|nr:DUF368 domain-containing protein [Actinomyces capricornis]BDA63723.1 DUF368 domain-containing protein [Actinomyces capricornis]